MDALLDEAERTLSDAGIVTARADVEQLAAAVFGSGQSDAQVTARFRDLVARRAERIPLGHLTGTATLGGVEVAVGPGVFVPRVHSEQVLASGRQALHGITAPLVVDLCTGSAAIALAMAHARPDATVHAVEFAEPALEFAARNIARRTELGDTPVRLHDADVTEPGVLSELDGSVHLVLANPPFVPEATELLPEYGVQHPKQAIFSGPDGLHVIRHVIAVAARLLRTNGVLVVEHGHMHGATMPALLHVDPRFADISTDLDHDDRPLYSVATRTEKGTTAQ